MLGILSLFDPAWWRGWSRILGLSKPFDLKFVSTTRESFLKSVREAGNFGFGVTHNMNPGFFQKGIEGATQSPWHHAFSLIGAEIGEKARKARPDLMERKPSPRWETRPGYYKPKIQGINPIPSLYEVVEAKIQMSVTDMLRDILNNDEQVILFTPQNWTEEQKVKMAIELYSWVGEPYDVPEIGNYVLPISPNSSNAKCCSTLAAQGMRIADNTIDIWCKQHQIDIQRIPPRDIFLFGAEQKYLAHCFQCDFQDAVKK